MSLTPGTRLGAYEVTAKLGEGGMGEVYRARDTKLDRDVAIKVLPDSFASDPDRLMRFEREAKTLASLNHPNIAGIYGIEDGPAEAGHHVRALVMELVEGEDLSARIARLRAPGASARQAGMPLDEALPIAKQIAEALEAAHEQGIIHRDLKPANIKVRPDGTVKVLDFGLAKALDEPKGSSPRDLENSPTITSPAMTQAGVILGTAAYMSPEQARGRVIDRRADIWAFGAVLFEMLTGRRAFHGDDISITLANVLKEEVEWSALPAAVSPSVRRLLRRCLEKDPKRRLSAIGDARLELDEVELPSIVTAAPGWRRAMPWAIAAMTTAGAIVVGILAFGSPRAAAPPVWTSIPPPVSGFGRSVPAVSPDGRRIVFGAADESGVDNLWLRALDGQSAQLIAGTTRALNPFWSPDGQAIAFFKDRKLLTVAAAGGTPRVLTDAVNGRGGTWNSDGVIVFVPDRGLGVLSRVSGSGGGPAAPLAMDRVVTAISWPSFLPDDRHFLFTALEGDALGVYIGSLDSPDTRLLLPAASRAQYASGRLLFGSKGVLYGQPFDPATLTLSGERAPIIDDVGVGAGNPLNYSFSASAHGEVIAAGHGPFVELAELTWLNPEGKSLGVLGAPGHVYGFTVAPDRTRLLLERYDPRPNSVDPWIMQIDTAFTTPLRAAVEGALAAMPVWSHDGRRVFYSNGYDAMRMAALSGETNDVWRVGPHFPNDSTPDGQSVVIDQGGDLMLVPLVGDHTPTPYVRTPFTENSARFSPDGRFVAYVSDESGRNEIYAQSFPAATARMRISVDGGDSPQWGDDGDLYYLQPAGNRYPTMMVASFRGGGPAKPRRVFDLPAPIPQVERPNFAVFDHGRRFLVNLEAPAARPQRITIGQNWTSSLGGPR